jgi:hypothetical protein
MKRRIRIAGATLAVAAGLIGAVGAPASAKTLRPAQALCTAQGGSFNGSISYQCEGAFSANQLRTAQTLCDKVFGFDFTPHPVRGYSCDPFF